VLGSSRAPPALPPTPLPRFSGAEPRTPKGPARARPTFLDPPSPRFRGLCPLSADLHRAQPAVSRPLPLGGGAEDTLPPRPSPTPLSGGPPATAGWVWWADRERKKEIGPDPALGSPPSRSPSQAPCLLALLFAVSCSLVSSLSPCPRPFPRRAFAGFIWD